MEKLRVYQFFCKIFSPNNCFANRFSFKDKKMEKISEKGQQFITPAFKTKNVPVCFAANNSYVSQTAVMIKSIVENATDENNYDLIILSTDISATNEENVKNLTKKKNISIRIFNISEVVSDIKFFVDSVYTNTTYSKEAYFRLFIPTLMPDYKKVIYFDGDMVAIKDIAPLMKINISKYLIAATRDFSGNACCYDKYSDRKKYRESLGLDKLDDYFISSMVIMNVEKFNKTYSLDYLKKLISSRNWRQHDQDILNVLCKDSLLMVDARWSYFEELDYAPLYLPEKYKKELLDAGKDPFVIHYAGTNKAWVDDNSSLTEYFWKYAKMTPYFDLFNGKMGFSKVAYRYFLFKDVFGSKIDYYYKYDDIVMSSTPQRIGKVSDLKVCIEYMYYKNGKLIIDGYYESVDLLGKLKMFALYDGEAVATYNSDYYRGYGYKSKIKKIRTFNAEIEVKHKKAKIEFLFTFDDVHFVRPNYISVEQFTPINEYKHCFYSTHDLIFSKPHGNYFVVEPHSRKRIFKLNNLVCKELKKRKNKYFSKIANVRKLFYYSKPFFRKKKIWLISDKLESVDKKTIEFYKYLKNNTDVSPYFVVGENCKNIDDLKKIGKVLISQSKMHKFLFMHAKVVLSSVDHYRLFLPMFDRSNEIRDLIANKAFIYLQKNEKEDLSYNVKTYYNTSLFVLCNDKNLELMKKLNNGYSDENYCVLKNTKDYNENLYKRIVEHIYE